MTNLPLSKLPDPAKPWGRKVESEIDSLWGAVAALQEVNSDLSARIESQTAQLTRLQNYVRTLCDLGGYLYPPAAAPPVPTTGNGSGEAPITPPKRKEITLDATWSCAWGSNGYKYPNPGGSDTDSQSLYQAGSGAKFSMFRFDLGAARGKKIVKVELFMSNISSYYPGSFTALLGGHGNSAEPASKPGGRTNAFNAGWNTGASKWIAVPSSYYAGLSNGTIQGFTLGDGSTSRQNYARFNGVGRAGAPKLRVTYED